MSTGAFTAASKKTFLGVATAAILYSASGRMLVSSGTGNTLLGTIILDTLFLIIARRSAALRDYSVSAIRWVCSVITVISSTLLVAAASVVTVMVIEQNESDYYRGFDNFVVTSGPALFPDANRELYMIEDSEQNYVMVLLIALCAFLSFLMATVVSTTVGTVTGAKGTRAGSITIGMTLAALSLFNCLLDMTDSVPGVPWSAVPIFTLVVTVISAFAMAGALKGEKRPLPTVRPALTEA